MSSRTSDVPTVAHLIDSLKIGGTERQLVQFIRRSSNPSRHVVVTFNDPAPLDDQVRIPPVTIGSFGRRPHEYPGNFRAVWSLFRLVRDLDVDIVHAHLGVSEILAALAVPGEIPLLASRRGRNVGFEQAGWLKLVEGWGHRKVDLMLCNSQYLADYTRRHDLWPPPMRVIPNAVDLETFTPRELPPFDRPTLVMVANLKWYKRQQDFLRALRIVADELPAVRAVLVGDGADREMLESLTSELGLDENVEFAGQVIDVRPYVERGHVVTLTSLHEGFPNGLLEGMAMGRPVVATRVGGIPELVREGVDGILVEGEPEPIAAGFVRMLSDRRALERMAANAAARAREYTWERVVRETEAVYRELAGRSHGEAVAA